MLLKMARYHSFLWLNSVQLSCSVLSILFQMPDFLVHHKLLEFAELMSNKSLMPSNHLILCHPLLLLPSTFPSIRGFSNESVLHIRWPKYWSFSFSISPFNEYSGLISFRIDWFDLLGVQGTLKSLLQQKATKASILWLSAFFMVQLHIWTWLLGKPKPWLYRPLYSRQSDISDLQYAV